MGRARDETGSSSLQTVLVVPVLLLLITAIVQFGLWYHAAHVALAAAQDGARAARVDGGSNADGTTRANQLLDQLGHGVLVEPNVSVSRTAGDVRVEVHGYAPRLVPMLRLRVSAVTVSPIERFHSPTEAP